MATKPAIVKALAVLGNVFTPPAPGAVAILTEVWQTVFEDIPDDHLMAAVSQHCATSKFFPVPAELRAAALQITSPARQTAAEAWDAVHALLQRHGYSQRDQIAAQLDDPTRQTAQAIGWYNLCFTGDDFTYSETRRMFFKTYDAILARQVSDALMPPSVARLAAERRAQLLAPLTAKLTAPTARLSAPAAR